MTDPHADVDPRPLLRALGVEQASAITRVIGGWDTALWRVDIGRTRFALRVFRPEQRQTWTREQAAMTAAAAGGVPVPKIQAAGIVGDRPALLLSWLPGQTLLAAASRPWRVWRLGTAFGRAQARIHRVTAPAAWRDDTSPSESPSTPPELRARLQALDLRADALLHLDYHPLNVMIERSSVSGVLDWANARRGDPRFDLAKTIAILRLAPVQPGVAIPAVLLARRLLELAYRRGYGPTASRDADLAPFHAWAGAWLQADLAPKLGRPGVWLRQTDLDRIATWATHWLASPRT